MSKQMHEERSFARILGFSDGVFAIAITLLILTIEIPDSISFATNEDVWKELLLLSRPFFAYVLSFYLIGMDWVIHHRMFRSIIKYDDGLIYRNLFCLFCVSFIPVPTMIISRAGDNSLAVAFYAFWIVLTSLSFRMLWDYAVKNKRLVEKNLSESYIRYSRLRGIIPLVTFSISIPLAFINPLLAELSWILLIVLRPKLIEKIMDWKK